MSIDLIYFRAGVAKGIKLGQGVDREKKIIHGYAVNTLGEAQGHGLWLDSDFLDSVVAAGNAAPNGIKARFTHPGLCSDGMGNYLGRTKNLHRDGNVVRGDLHIADAASKSPNGDLAAYVMDMAEEDPEAFGASIVFARNRGLEKEFAGKNSDNEGKFTSPDKSNAKNMPHARLDSLRACDVVDDPAANPGGFFSRGEELATVGETALEYLTGERDEVPAETFGGLAPERVKTFFDSFLQRHSLHVARTNAGAKQEAVPMTAEEKAAAQEEFRAAERTRVAALKAAFPNHPNFVVAQIESGASLAEAQNAHKDVLLAEALAENAALKAAPKPTPAPVSAPRTGPAPTAFDGEPADPDAGKDFMALSRDYARANKCSLTIAITACTDLHRDAHAAYVESMRNAKPRKIERPPSK